MGQKKQLTKRRVYEIYLNIQPRGLLLSIIFPVRWTTNVTWTISCSCREVGENCALLGYYAGSSANSLTTFRDNLSGPSSWMKEEGNCKLVPTEATVHTPRIRSFIVSRILLGFLTPEDGTYRLYRNPCKKLSLLSA